MMRFYSALISSLILCASAIGCSNDENPIQQSPSTGIIVGHVTSSAGQAISGASVSTIPATQSKLTDAAGAFTLPDVAPATYVVSVSKDGFNPGSATVTVGAGKTVTADIVLSSGPPNNLPNEPINPTPSDGAVAQSIELTLRWEASDPDQDTLRFDVLLGKSNPPTDVVASNQIQRVHYVPSLDSNTTYYWQVIARDGRGGVRSSAVWSFRTVKRDENKAPLVPSNPSPANGSVHNSAQVSLSWTCFDPELDALRYDVYFGTTESPSKVASDISSSSVARGGLAPNAQYYWRVVARDNHGGETSGPLWSFTTNDLDEGPGLGLVAYYPLNGSGEDASGNGYAGTMYNVDATANRHGQPGQASYFDGSAYMRVAHRSALVFAMSDFTISAWIRLGEEQIDYAGILSKCTPSAPEHGYQLVIRNGAHLGIQIGASVPSGSPYFDLIAPEPLSLGQWHHVAMVVRRDDRTVSIYVDGDLMIESQDDHLAYSMDEDVPLYLGRERQGVRWFRGGIDDVKIFSGALSAQQILALSNE